MFLEFLKTRAKLGQRTFQTLGVGKPNLVGQTEIIQTFAAASFFELLPTSAVVVASAICN